MQAKRTMPRSCERCGADFLAVPYEVRVGKARFCSRTCAQRGPLETLVCMEDGTVGVPLRAADGSLRAYAIIDSGDADFVRQWRWCLIEGYAARNGRGGSNGATIKLHRELLSLMHGDGMEGDHINRNRLDNRRSNLRAIPKQGRPNNQNRTKGSGGSSQFRGVYWRKDSRRWAAFVRSKGRSVHLGLFENELAAAEAARTARANLMPYATD